MPVNISRIQHVESSACFPFIEMKNISLHFSAHHEKSCVLEDITFQLYKGDFVCVLGPSGCGKSSLLHVLAGFQKPTSGDITIDGTRHTRPNSDVGVVFQHHNLFPWLSIQKNIEFGLKMKGIPRSERKNLVSSYLKIVGLEDSAAKWPYQLSGGMKQRAAIARTLAADPKVILMDEPFSALDALTRESMQNHLHRIWIQTKKCIFFITHDVEEALLLGTRIVVMQPNPGRIVVDMPNPLPRHKSIEENKHVKEFNDLRNYLISMIRKQ